MLTVSEARRLGVCRVCEQPIGIRTLQLATGETLHPVRVTYNFGREHAHTACLTPERLRAEQLERRALDHLIVRL